MRSQRIPKIDSIEELASFWDTHDLTDFEADLEVVRTPVFSRQEENIVEVALTAKEALTLRRLAKAEGVKEAKLVKKWVGEKLRAPSLKRPPKPVRPAAEKTRRG